MSEAILQRRIIRALRDRWPSFIIHHSTPPVASKQARIAAKAQGAVSGFFDLIVLGHRDPEVGVRGGPVTVLLEVKTERGRLTESQQRFVEKVQPLQHHFSVVRSPEDAIAAVENALEWG